jgi:hypothetical protein
MKIIDNKKDYYDYVSGIYGIDPYVVYDRRKSVPSRDIIEKHPTVFSKEACYMDDNPGRQYGRRGEDSYFIDNMYDITIEAGEKHFYIRAHRRRKTKDSPIELTFETFDPFEMLKRQYHIDLFGKSSFFMDRYQMEVDKYRTKQSKAPLALFIMDYGGSWPTRNTEIENPILKELPITGLIPAEEIWQGIYDYLLKMKEPVVIDSRTNDEHIESAGFDKKTSFRNVK